MILNIYKYIKNIFTQEIQPKVVDSSSEAKNFFDLSSRDRVRIMRAAGRDAQREQQILLAKYAAVYKTQ